MEHETKSTERERNDVDRAAARESEPAGRTAKERSGLGRFLYSVIHRRHRYRQFAGISFVILVTLLGAPAQPFYTIGAVLVVLGVAARLWASGYIKKDKSLATGGPYAFVRHPLYVGNITLGLGFCLASGLWWSLPLQLAILLLCYPPAIHREDDKLHRLFGKDWEDWNAAVRALIPRFSPYAARDWGGWSFWWSLRRNGEPLIALFLLGCLSFLFVRW